jgi:mannose PTS system EIIA component
VSGPVRVLVVTHGQAGAAMLAAVRGLVGVGVGDDFEALAVGIGETRAEMAPRIREAVERLDAGGGVLVCCDLFGSTPSNCAVDLARGGRATVLGGVNLPMLIKLASIDRSDTTPAALAQVAAETASRSIRRSGSGSGET